MSLQRMLLINILNSIFVSLYSRTMEFKAVYGSHHMIEPLGYLQVRKRINRGAHVRSAKEQFMIHSLAYEYKHPHITTVKPLMVESAKSYIMEELPDFARIIPETSYNIHIDLFTGLMEFQQFMVQRGYWPYGYTVMLVPSVDKCYILDYSQFGTIDRDRVRFPGEPYLRTTCDIEDRFPLAVGPPAESLGPMTSPLLDLTLEKIDELEELGLMDA
jgi:hypothetical protein